MEDNVENTNTYSVKVVTKVKEFIKRRESIKFDLELKLSTYIESGNKEFAIAVDKELVRLTNELNMLNDLLG